MLSLSVKTIVGNAERTVGNSLITTNQLTKSVELQKDAEAERMKKAEAARIAAIEREEAQRREKIEEYMESKKRLEEELSTLHGLFTLKRRKEIESTLMWYDMEINNLK